MEKNLCAWTQILELISGHSDFSSVEWSHFLGRKQKIGGNHFGLTRREWEYIIPPATHVGGEKTCCLGPSFVKVSEFFAGHFSGVPLGNALGGLSK